KKEAKELAQALMANHKLAGKKYNQLYNGNMMHLGLTGM
ncbi:hypothetical protein L917_18843, partial [Phytophthora nicotianae]